MRNDLINYNGAYIYPVEDGTYEANLFGFHYSADTLDEIKAKIDKYKNAAEDSFKYVKATEYHPQVYGTNDRLFEDAEDEIWWAVTYYLPALDREFDDMDSSAQKTVEIEAADFDLAVKYANQYIIKMQKSENGDIWTSAEILSIERR